MVYILSINLINTKSISVEICKLYGIGKYQAIKLCNSLNIGKNIYFADLNQANLYSLLKQIEFSGIVVEAALYEQKKNSISKLIEIKSYKGVRHIFKLPVRGQRTKTNANTRKKVKD